MGYSYCKQVVCVLKRDEHVIVCASVEHLSSFSFCCSGSRHKLESDPANPRYLLTELGLGIALLRRVITAANFQRSRVQVYQVLQVLQVFYLYGICLS